jgi:multicomponent Na+:H+ antiporter subunit C
MEVLLSVIVGLLFSASIFMLLQRNLVKLIIGISLLSNAANLLIFTAGRITRGTPPLIPIYEELIQGPFANPLSEALILTAIVIGFGLLAFTLVLVYRIYSEFNSIDADQITSEADRGEVT